MPKKIKRPIENNLSRNGYTVTSSDTFQMFPIPLNKISNNLLRRSGGVVWRCSVKNVILNISQNSQQGTCKIDLKINLNPAQWCFPVNLAKFLRTPFS